MSFLKIAVTVLSLAFGGPTAPTFNLFRAGQAAAPRVTWWRGATGDLSVDLRIEQFGDSVFAKGTYKVGVKNRVGCGGETLSRAGHLTMTAQGTLASFQGKFLFDSGWTPPLSAKQGADGSIKVSIRSVDRGGCLMTLTQRAKVTVSRP